jgi:membrane protease YdiL (CAAX protease family)
MALEKLFGKHFASFKLRALPRGPDQAQPSARKLIGNPEHERLLWANHGQVGPQTSRQIGQSGRVVGVGGDALCILRYAAVSRSAPDLLHRSAAPQTPGQRVFASPAPDDKYFHSGHATIRAARARVNGPMRPRPLASAEDWCSHLKAMQLAAIPWDLAVILFLLAIVVPWRGAVRVRRLLAHPALSSRGRIAIYTSTIAFQWVLAVVTAWRCIARGWSLPSLGLALWDRPAAIAVGLALAATLALVQVAALRQVSRIPPERRGRLMEIAGKLMPQNLIEVFPFVALVCTVSLCEEFLYRGFVYSAFQRSFGGSATAASLGSSVLFGIGHVYQGRRGMINTLFLGMIFAGVRFWTGSLAPSVLAHFAVDLVAGFGGSRWALPQTQAEDAATTVAGADSRVSN